MTQALPLPIPRLTRALEAGLQKLRAHPLLNPVALEELWHERGGHAVDPTHGPHLLAALDWLARAQAANGDDGFARGYSTSAFGLTVSPVAAKDGEMQRDAWYSYARRRRTLEDPESIGRTAAARALRRLGARKVKTTEVPVIFDPDMAASLLRSMAGAASGPSLYRRASFLLERLGTRVAAPTVTIVDDGLLPAALGSRPFDGEGLATRRTVLVGEGKLESYLLDTYSGRKLGLTSTHHASRDGAGVSVGTTNLMLLAGTTPPAELIGSVKSGLYVTELIGFGVNGVTGDYSRGAAGLWIEDGRLTFPVEEVTVAGNLLEMFDRIEGIGNDLVLRDRVSAPTLKIARMVVAGD